MHQPQNAQIYRRLLNYLWQFKRFFLLGVLGTFLASGIAAGFSWFIRPLLNKGFISPNIHFIHWIPVIVIGAYLVLGAAAFIGDVFMALAARHVVMTLQRQLFHRFLNLPASFFDRRASGELIAILTYNIEQVTETFTTVLMTLLSDGFLIIGLIVVMLMNSWQLTLLYLVTVPLIAIIVTVFAKHLKKISLKIQAAVGVMTHIAKETVSGYRIMRSFGGKKYEASKFGDVTQLILKRQVQLVMLNSLGISSTRICAAFAVAITIYLVTGTHFDLSAGAFMSTITAMISSLKPLRKLAQINSGLQKGVAGAESVFSILDEPLEQNSGEIQIERSTGKINIQDLTFHYDLGSHSVLHNINLTIAPGQKIGFVGHSGSGKSTMMHLLQRYYLPQSGKIELDDVDIKHIELTSLRNQFAVVSEDIPLVNDTMLKNIAYGYSGDIDMVQLEQALKSAYLWDFIQSLPEGFNTPVGENGVLLSSGQRQRLAIARAILKDAPILILDEATSRLDPKTEQQIHAALSFLMRDRTTIVIAHRLSTIETMDRLFVLHNGRLVESGQHQSLIKQAGYYARLYEYMGNGSGSR